MQTVEITAKSVQEATKNAAAKLGVASDAIKVTVLEETKGLFGKSTVRIKAEVAQPEPVSAAPVAAPSKPAKKSPKAAAPVEAPAREPVVEEPVPVAVAA